MFLSLSLDHKVLENFQGLRILQSVCYYDRVVNKFSYHCSAWGFNKERLTYLRVLSSRYYLSVRTSSAGAITVHSVVAPPGELRVKAGVMLLAGKTVWYTPEHLRGEVLTRRRYTNPSPFTFTILAVTQCCCPRGNSLSLRTNLQVLVLVFEP